MLGLDLPELVATTAAVLFVAGGWFLNTRLARVHDKLDRVLGNLDGLRRYLYEIDPQFDDERESAENFERGDDMLAGMSDADLLQRKKKSGKRTLNTRFEEPPIS